MADQWALSKVEIKIKVILKILSHILKLWEFDKHA